MHCLKANERHGWCKRKSVWSPEAFVVQDESWLVETGRCTTAHGKKSVGFFLEGFEHVVFRGVCCSKDEWKKELKHKPLVPLIFKNKDLRQAIRRWVGQGLASGATYILNYNDDIDV